MQVTDAVKVLYALRKDEESVSGQVFFTLAIVVKVEKILKDSLDLIPSPSTSVKIMGGKVCLRCKGKTLLGVVNKLLKVKIFCPITSNKLSPHNLNFH